MGESKVGSHVVPVVLYLQFQLKNSHLQMENTCMSLVQVKPDHLLVDLWSWWGSDLLLGQLHPQVSDLVLLPVERLQELRQMQRQEFSPHTFVFY